MSTRCKACDAHLPEHHMAIEQELCSECLFYVVDVLDDEDGLLETLPITHPLCGDELHVTWDNKRNRGA